MVFEEVVNSSIVQTLSGIPGVDVLIRLGQIAAVLVIVYVAFLILQAVLKIRRAMDIGRIVRAVEDINKKMTLLLGKKAKIFEKEKAEEEKRKKIRGKEKASAKESKKLKKKKK